MRSNLARISVVPPKTRGWAKMDSRKSASSRWKRPLPIEKSRPQRHYSRRIGAQPTHPLLFHATVDHDGHGSFNNATANRIALLFPLLR